MTQQSQIREAIKLALSMALFFWLALWMNWDMPKYGALAIILISLGTSGASLAKGVLRIVGTTFGLAVGLFVLSVFSQDRLGTLVFHACYLLMIGYFMQGSRFGYAWFVAGFLPPLVWGSTYMKVDTAFDYAVFRYLETSAGVIIYTIVSVMLWPRRAGDQLDGQGVGLWVLLGKSFKMIRGRLAGDEVSRGAMELRTKLGAMVAQMEATRRAAAMDTSGVASQRRVWDRLFVDLRTLGDTLALWSESVEDCRGVDLGRVLVRLEAGLETIAGRFERAGGLWSLKRGADPGGGAAVSDGALLEPIGVELERSVGAELSLGDRAAVMNFVRQLDILDVTSRGLVRSMRVLRGIDSVDAIEPCVVPQDVAQPTGWSIDRLIRACFPALCFMVAFVVWVFIDPPAGPGMVHMSAVFSLMLLMTWMSPIPMILCIIGSVVFIVAPVYFVLMPRLDSGLGLLSLVFFYTFIFGYLGGRNPMLKMCPLVALFMVAGITNRQVYSFSALVDGGLMLALSATVVGVVQMLLSPMRPEKAMLKDVRRFFVGCARVAGAYGHDEGAEPRRLRRVRVREFESRVSPVPGRLRKTVGRLDYSASAQDEPAKMVRLLDGMEFIALRIRAVDSAYSGVAGRLHESSPVSVSCRDQLRGLVQRAFERCARFDLGHDSEDRLASERLSEELKRSIEGMESGDSGRRLDDRLAEDLYVLVGSIRALIGAMGEARAAMSVIDWDHWKEERFS